MLWTHFHLAHDLDHQNGLSWRLKVSLERKKVETLENRNGVCFRQLLGSYPNHHKFELHILWKWQLGPLRVLDSHIYWGLEITERHFRLNFKIDMFCLLFCMIVILCWKEWYTCIQKWPVIGLLSETYKKSYSKAWQVILKVLKTWAQVQY